jgi:RNA polymerase sigma-70 factor, ECF subfamily
VSDALDPRAARDRADLEAMARLQRGDVAAVSVLYEAHGRTAYGLALKIVRDPAEAEDVVQDAFVAVVKRADQYHSARGSVAAWLITAVRNLALDRSRRRTRRHHIVEAGLRHEEPDAPADPETSLGEFQGHARMREALSALPPAQRETLEIAFFEGLSYPEIAAREGVPLGTVKSRAARALHALKDLLERADRTAAP